MKIYIKNFLKNNLNKDNYNKILITISYFNNFLFSINFLFKRFKYKNIKFKKIKNNLIIISQVQRSGGTLLSQLFDSHPQIHSYPSELKLTKPKFDWTKK